MYSPYDTPKGVGFPIRTSRDQNLLAVPPGLSQRATSFIASQHQGIHQMPFIHSPLSSNQTGRSNRPLLHRDPSSRPPAARQLQTRRHLRAATSIVIGPSPKRDNLTATNQAYPCFCFLRTVCHANAPDPQDNHDDGTNPLAIAIRAAETMSRQSELDGHHLAPNRNPASSPPRLPSCDDDRENQSARPARG